MLLINHPSFLQPIKPKEKTKRGERTGSVVKPLPTTAEKRSQNHRGRVVVRGQILQSIPLTRERRITGVLKLKICKPPRPLEKPVVAKNKLIAVVQKLEQWHGQVVSPLHMPQIRPPPPVPYRPQGVEPHQPTRLVAVEPPRTTGGKQIHRVLNQLPRKPAVGHLAVTRGFITALRARMQPLHAGCVPPRDAHQEQMLVYRLRTGTAKVQPGRLAVTVHPQLDEIITELQKKVVKPHSEQRQHSGRHPRLLGHPSRAVVPLTRAPASIHLRPSRRLP